MALDIKELSQAIRAKVRVGQEYKVKIKGEVSRKMTVLGVYPHIVLFEDQTGKRESFVYIDAYKIVNGVMLGGEYGN